MVVDVVVEVAWYPSRRVHPHHPLRRVQTHPQSMLTALHVVAVQQVEWEWLVVEVPVVVVVQPVVVVVVVLLVEDQVEASSQVER